MQGPLGQVRLKRLNDAHRAPLPLPLEEEEEEEAEARSSSANACAVPRWPDRRKFSDGNC